MGRFVYYSSKYLWKVEAMLDDCYSTGEISDGDQPKIVRTKHGFWAIELNG